MIAFRNVMLVERHLNRSVTWQAWDNVPVKCSEVEIASQLNGSVQRRGNQEVARSEVDISRDKCQK